MQNDIKILISTTFELSDSIFLLNQEGLICI